MSLIDDGLVRQRAEPLVQCGLAVRMDLGHADPDHLLGRIHKEGGVPEPAPSKRADRTELT